MVFRSSPYADWQKIKLLDWCTLHYCFIHSCAIVWAVTVESPEPVFQAVWAVTQKPIVIPPLDQRSGTMGMVASIALTTIWPHRVWWEKPIWWNSKLIGCCKIESQLFYYYYYWFQSVFFLKKNSHPFNADMRSMSVVLGVPVCRLDVPWWLSLSVHVVHCGPLPGWGLWNPTVPRQGWFGFLLYISKKM